jgi:hypothetical protein
MTDATLARDHVDAMTPLVFFQDITRTADFRATAR